MGRKIITALFLFFIMSLAWSQRAWAQSETESLIVMPVTVPNGTSTFYVTISLANSVPISGITGRIVFDPNVIQPVVLDVQGDVAIDLINRGLAFRVNGVDFAGASSPAAGVVTFGLFPDFSPPLEQINAGSGSVCRIQFTVRSPNDTSICVIPEDDPVDQSQVKNQLSDNQGLLIVPSLAGGTVQLGAGSATGGCGPGGPGGGGGGVNTPPVINPVANQSVPQGSILTFSVSARDPDGGFVTLSATSLPQNATFNTVTGDSIVSGTCTFAPSLAQLGDFTANFRAVDDSGAAVSRSVNITVTPVDKDILFSSSVTGQAPTGAIPGKRAAFFPIDLTVRDQVYGVQFDLQFDTAVVQVDSILPSERLQNFIIDSRNLGGQLDRIRVLAFSLQGDSLRPAATPTILNVALSVSPLARPGKTNMVIDSGYESVNPDPRVPSQSMITQSGEFFIDRFGDANLDTLINVADVVSLVSFILGRNSLAPRQFDAANTDQDSVVNIIDLVNIINLIFGNPLPPPAPRYIGPTAQLALNARPFVFNPSEPIQLEAELPMEIAGVQVHVDYNPAELKLEAPRQTVVSGNLIMKYNEDVPGRLSVVLYNMGGSRNEIPVGRSTILNIPATRLSGIGDTLPPKLSITRAFLSTGKGEGVPVAGIGASLPRQFELFQNYPNPFNPKTTIRFEIAAADGYGGAVPVRLEVFNILGQSVKTLLNERRAPGRYSLEWDGTDASGSRVSSGIYLYRLTSDKFSVTKKMVFLK